MPAGCGHKGSKAPPKKRPKMQPESRISLLVTSGVQGKHALPQSQDTSPPFVSAGNSSCSSRTLRDSSNVCPTVTVSVGSGEIVETPGHHGSLIMNTGPVNIHSPTEVTYAHCSSSSSSYTLCFYITRLQPFYSDIHHWEYSSVPWLSTKIS